MYQVDDLEPLCRKENLLSIKNNGVECGGDGAMRALLLELLSAKFGVSRVVGELSEDGER